MILYTVKNNLEDLGSLANRGSEKLTVLMFV
jgi:hypothetical protein